MNIDFIDVMRAGPEMDKRVAELVMKWHRPNDGLNMWCTYRTSENTPNSTDEWRKRFPDLYVGYLIEDIDPRRRTNEEDEIDYLREIINNPTWKPSSDIRCAWVVADIFVYATIQFDGVTWSARLHNGTRELVAYSDIDNPIAELAICRAALKFHATNIT